MKPIEAIAQECLRDRTELVRSLTAVLERTKPGTKVHKQLLNELSEILNPQSARNLGQVAIKAATAITPRYVVAGIAMAAGVMTATYLYNRYRKQRHA